MRILEKLNSKISRWSMPPDPSRCRSYFSRTNSELLPPGLEQFYEKSFQRIILVALVWLVLAFDEIERRPNLGHLCKM